MKAFFLPSSKVSGKALPILALLFFAIGYQANSQRFSVASGSWNDPNTWSATSGGAAGASVPLAGDAVTIERGFIVNITADAACSSLQLGGLTANNPGAITFDVGAINLVVSGAIQVGGSGNANRDGSITFQNGTTVSAGSINLGGTLATPGQGTITMTLGGTLTVTGTVTVTGAGNAFTAGTGLVQLSGTSTLIAPFTAFNSLTINGGATSLGANITVGGALNVSAGSLDANTRTTVVTGLATISGGTYLASTALQTFNGGLTISGGTFTGSTGGVTTTNVTLSSGTLTAPSGTFNVSGNWTNNGGVFAPGANTITFNLGGAQAINGTATAQTFNNITIAKTAGTLLSVTGSTTTLNVAALTQTTGNFTAPATVNATGAITLTAGTYTAGANTNLENNFINNGGTFAAGTNTVTFTGSGAKTIAGTNATTASFYDLVINSGSVFFGNNATARTMNITNNFTINAGSFLSGATVAAVHIINLTGNLTNNGTLDLNDNSATAHRFVFSGAGTKTISGSGIELFRNVRMSTTGSANVNVNSNVQINGTLDWTADGLLVLGAANITFGSAAAITTPGALRYIQSDGSSSLTGQVLRINDNNAGTWKFLFPIGTATGGYSPLDLTNAATIITTAPTLNSTLAAKAILSADAPGRLKRTFRMTVAGNSNATTFTNGRFSYFSPGDVSGSELIATYNTIWYQRESIGVWTSLTGTAPGVNLFIASPVAQPLTNDTYYFTIGTSGAFGQTWYSYQTGNWSNPLSWTTDGSSFPLYVNPTNAIPGVADNVVITSGKTISMDVSSTVINGINVIGTLDVLATTGHSFNVISGPGKIKIAGTSDNFPAGTATNFADSAIGGTLEVNGSGMLLIAARTFNNVVVNMTTASNTAVLKNNIIVNGDLTITRGLLQFEDLTGPANRTLTVNGNVIVGVSGGIRTINSNNRHEFNLQGDFVNSGTAYFTNRIAIDYNSAEATDGIVDVNMISSSRDQQVTCNGETRFYRIEVNKGTDDTYKATISASDPANFSIFGKANYDINSASGANDNALGLIAGTAEIGTNVSLLLNTVNNYAIFTNARLLVNGGNVTKNGNAIVPYGTVTVSDGTLTSDGVGGVTIRDAGAFIVEGGVTTITCVRTSTNGATAVGSYIQSGGTVTLNGTSINTDYAVFSLTYTGNVFNMSGGTLTIQTRPSASTTRGSVFINSDPANISVTGGTVVLEADNAVPFRITSRSPFWNLTMRATGGTRTIELLGTMSGDAVPGGPPDEVTLAIQPLSVLNDFTIENNAVFTTNNANVTVGGNFEIQNGGTYTHGTNTTTINGSGVSSLVFGNAAATQTFNNLTISKSVIADEVVIVTGRPSPNAAIQINGALTISGGTFDYSTFIVSVPGSVSLASGVTVGKSPSTGKVALTGTTDQIITTFGASIYNLEINNTDATPQVSLASGNLTVLGTLTMTAGIFDINTRRLTLNGAAATISGTGFGTSKMIQMAGNAGDGGLEMYFNANESITYPIGTNANSTTRYTPATVQIQSFVDDGLIRISIEDRLLQLANLPATNSLSYNWRVINSNFGTLPLSSFRFTYAESDADGSQAAYVPGKVLTDSPFTRSSEAGSDIDIATNIITFNGSSTGAAFPGAGFTLDNAAYTAGASGMFTGAPEVYYNRANGQTGWNDNNKWSLVGFNGTATNNQPGPGDVVLMTNFGGTNESWVLMDVDVEVAAITFSNTGGGWLPRVTVTNGRTVSLGVVSGTGEIMVEVNPALPTLNLTDIGDFARQASSMFIYKVQNDATYNMYAFTEYPNLRIEGNSGGTNNGLRVMQNTFPVTVNRDLWMDWGGSFRAGADVNIVRDLLPGVGGGGGGRFQFGEGGSYTVTVGRNLSSTNSANNRVEVLNTTPATRVHTLKIGGSITQTTGQIDLFNGTGTANNAILELNSTTSGSYTNASGNTMDLFRINMNKGLSIASTFTLTDNVNLNGPFDGTTKPLVLTNGLLILDNAALNFTLTSGGADFNIPGSAGLEVRQGSASTSTTSTLANITLDGLLRVSGGTVNINGGGATDTNFIEYSNSGNAAIEVTSGSLTVAGQVRRSLVSTTGVLKYTQSGGTVLVGNEAAPSNTRGVFEVLNPGSQFNHSGGSFTVVRGQGSGTVSSFWLEPGSSNITAGSTITIGNASTPAGTIGIESSVALNNLTINGLAANTPQVSMYVRPLTVNGVVTVATGNTLNALGRDLTVGGNFTINGTYTSGNNTTIFNNSGSATIGGVVSALSFYNFTKLGSGTLSLARDITVNRDLKVSAGTLATATFAINLLRHAEIDATISSTSGNGLIFGSTVTQQQLTRSAAGTGAMGIVTINNPNGVIVPDGNGYDFSVSTNLRMQSGIFDIGGGLLTLGVSALITPVNPYSATNLIQTNSSFTDKGVRKIFPTNYTTDFIFPVGQSNYTPVTFTFSGGNTTGSSGTPTITVRPSNRRHPVIINDNGPGELPDPITFNDLNNVLQYYWIIGATGVASDFKSNMALQYTQPLVSVVNPYSETDYIAARILTDLTINPTLGISKFSTAEVNEATNIINFNFNSVIDGRSIAGDYFAGVDEAIPTTVTTYTTVTSGNVNAAIYDTPVFGGIPTGARVVVAPGHTVNFNVSSVILYQTVINAGSKVVIPDGSIGHSLGVLSGTGDLEINSDGPGAVLPAAEYDTFFSCAGGGLIFGGTGSYEILGGITALRNLTLNGTGDKSMANNDLTVCNNFTLNGGAFFNSGNQNIIVQNDVLVNGGTYNNLGGTLSITRDLTQTLGGFEGGTGGTKLIGRNLTVTGGTFNPGSGTTNVIRINGNMTVNIAATITTGTGGVTGQRFTFGGASPQLLTGDFTGSRAFNRLEINNTSGLTFAGDVTVISQLQLTNGLITPGSNRFLMTGTAVAAPTAGSTASFVNGKLFKTITAAGSNFTFPIGKSSRWRSGALFLSAGAINAGQTWDMEYFAGAATGAVAQAPSPRNNPVSNFTSSDPLVLRMATGEYWRVSDGSATSNGRTARVGLSWGVESDVSANLAQREAMKVMTWNGTNWTNSGGTNFQPGGTHTQSRGTFESTNTLSFSENIVTLGSTEVANALPVTLVKFQVELNGSIATLNWKTASEINNDYFEVQRSADSQEFVEIGRVSGNGTTITAIEYFFDDRSLLKGKNYYRLKQVDFDGTTAYSDVISVFYDGSTPLNVLLFPNPTNSENVNLELINPTSEPVSIRILDLTGRASFQATVQLGELESIIRIKSDELRAGVYIVEVIQGAQRVVKRLAIKN